MNSHPDVLVIGGGPAGLSAALNAKLEGFSTLVLEREAWGGRASQSARIDNVLGHGAFGISGPDLTSRALDSLARFACERREGEVVEMIQGYIKLRDGVELFPKAIVIATGMQWKELDIPGLVEALASGKARYGCMVGDGPRCAGKTIAVLGGANSAGINALHFAESGAHVLMLMRGRSYSAGMSHYLKEQLLGMPNIIVMAQLHLDEVSLAERGLDLRMSNGNSLHCDELFLFPDAVPNASFANVAKDAKGFIVAPHFESSQKGIFVAGDVRSQSVKRIATAIGEGAAVILKVKRFWRNYGNAARVLYRQ